MRLSAKEKRMNAECGRGRSLLFCFFLPFLVSLLRWTELPMVVAHSCWFRPIAKVIIWSMHVSVYPCLLSVGLIYVPALGPSRSYMSARCGRGQRRAHCEREGRRRRRRGGRGRGKKATHVRIFDERDEEKMFDVQTTRANSVNVFFPFSPVSPRLCPTRERERIEGERERKTRSKLNTAQLFVSHSSMLTVLFSSPSSFINVQRGEQRRIKEKQDECSFAEKNNYRVEHVERKALSLIIICRRGKKVNEET